MYVKQGIIIAVLMFNVADTVTKDMYDTSAS